MNREYDPTKPYNPANKVFVFFLVILIAVSIAWYIGKKADFDFENMWNQIVEDFTSEETTTPSTTNYDNYYNEGKIEDVFSGHTNELNDLLKEKIDTNTNFKDLDLSNKGITISATCKSFYNICISYSLKVEGTEITVYAGNEDLDHLY